MSNEPNFDLLMTKVTMPWHHQSHWNSFSGHCGYLYLNKFCTAITFMLIYFSLKWLTDFWMATGLASNFYLRPKNLKQNKAKSNLGSYEDHKSIHTHSNTNKLQPHTHQMKSSIKWRLPNICLTLFINFPVRYAEQDSNESDCSSDVNWSSRSRGDIYLNKRNNCIIQVSWKVESISYVSGPVVLRIK